MIMKIIKITFSTLLLLFESNASAVTDALSENRLRWIVNGLGDGKSVAEPQLDGIFIPFITFEFSEHHSTFMLYQILKRLIRGNIPRPAQTINNTR